MATYFSDSNTQRDAETMLYSKEPLPSSYSETPITPGNLMMFTSYASSSGGSYSDTFAGNSQQPIPNPSQQDILSNPGGSRIELSDYGTWKNGRNDMALMQPTGDATGVVLQQGQGLSLSLGTHVTPGFHDSQVGFFSFLGPNQLISSEGNGGNVSFGDNGRSSVNQSRISDGKAEISISSFGISSISRTISNSKYLNAAQELLDEVVHVRIALNKHNSEKELAGGIKELDGGSKNGSLDPSATGTTGNAQDSSKNELSAAEKQDLQNKLSKLSSMLDEVDHRYKQYYHQMQIVVSSFNAVAGPGAAKTYTALALQTISRHFRSLRDAINRQIQITRKSLGEQDASSNSKGITISRLRYVDQKLKQQRALQQLGMMQQHAWRPQRGLPENAVSVLRAWLFEHFLHPYPKDSEKIMLARQAGLTRSQVSNWFINARVRLWKPMVEEMYKEETGDAEMDSTSSAEMVTKATESDTKVSEDRLEDLQQTSTSTAMEHQNFFESKFDHKTDTEIGNLNTNAAFHNITHGETQNSYEVGRIREDQNSYAYDMSEIERFGNGDGNGVSLTLGLQRCEGGNLPVSIGNDHSFVTMREDDIYDEITPSSIVPETTEFDCIDASTRHNKFGSSRYFHDFVA